MRTVVPLKRGTLPVATAAAVAIAGSDLRTTAPAVCDRGHATLVLAHLDEPRRSRTERLQGGGRVSTPRWVADLLVMPEAEEARLLAEFEAAGCVASAVDGCSSCCTAPRDSRDPGLRQELRHPEQIVRSGDQVGPQAGPRHPAIARLAQGPNRWLQNGFDEVLSALSVRRNAREPEHLRDRAWMTRICSMGAASAVARADAEAV